MTNGIQPCPLKAQQPVPVPRRPVAVIAVHGVGRCQPFATVRHVASLLLGLGRLKLDAQRPWPYDGNPPYAGCCEQLIQVPLAPAPVNEPHLARARQIDAIAPWFKRLLHYWDERRGYLADVFAGRRPIAQVAADLVDRGRLAHQFMRAQLAGYVSAEDGQAYDTIRVETERACPDGQKQKVHIYELYWADLARPQGNVVSFFNALYQLLFHLGSLSRTAVDYAAVEHIHRRSWRSLSFFQALAVRFLVLPVLILNLILLIAALTVLPLKIDLDHGLLSAALLGVTLLVIVLRWWPHVASRPWVWYGSLAAFSVAGFAAGYFLLTIADLSSRKLAANIALAVEWWLAGGFLLLLLMKRYETVRRRALTTGLGLYFAALATFLSFLFGPAFSFLDPVEQASFWTIQVIMGALVVCWLILLFSAVIGWILQAVCLSQLSAALRISECGLELATDVASRTARESEVSTLSGQYARARAALRTARLALAVSASVFLLITIFLWAGAFSYTNKKLSLYTKIELKYPDLPFYLKPILTLFVPSGEDALRWIHERQTATAKTHTLPKQCTELAISDPIAPSFRDRLDKVRQKLKDHGIVARPPKVQSVEAGVNSLETAENVRPEHSLLGAPLDCETRVYHLEVKAGLTTESEFSIYARALLLAGTTSGMLIMAIFITLALVLLGCAVARSLIPSKTQLNRATNRDCARLGDWFSRGLDSTRAVTSLVWHSIFTVAVIFGVLDYFYSHGRLAWIPWIGSSGWLSWLIRLTNDSTLRVLDLVGARLAFSGVAIGALMYKYGRVPLDILLDVDNYLRTSPLENAPRARIAERYASLLRYVANQRSGDTPFYDSVVIAAHSLGALISADLLHYLKREPDPLLADLGYGAADQADSRIRIRLFTFGNPLRQLLNRFFPHLYWWVREEPDNSVNPMPVGTDDLPDIRPPRPPNPADLGPGVESWTNAYRSGDFVGRLLWADNWYRRTVNADGGAYPEAVAVARDIPQNPTRMEVCIGLGGHNDYWNRTAPDIAAHLDALITG